MKTQYFTAMSLDGFIATGDDSLNWLFPLGDINDTSYPATASAYTHPLVDVHQTKHIVGPAANAVFVILH